MAGTGAGAGATHFLPVLIAEGLTDVAAAVVMGHALLAAGNKAAFGAVGGAAGSAIAERLRTTVKPRESHHPYGISIAREAAGGLLERDREAPFLLVPAVVKAAERGRIPGVGGGGNLAPGRGAHDSSSSQCQSSGPPATSAQLASPSTAPSSAGCARPGSAGQRPCVASGAFMAITRRTAIICCSWAAMFLW